MGIHNAFAPIAAAAALAACAAAPDAAAQKEATPRTIAVVGEGRTVAAPDMATISIGVETQAETAGEALRRNSTQMAATIKKLKDLGVADRDIQTSNLSVHPRYDYQNNRSNRRIIGFTASNTATVRLRDLDKAGGVIDQATQSGANTLNGVSFGFSNPEPLKNAAREAAVEKARVKAELLTAAAGVELGQVLTIQDGHANAPTRSLTAMRRGRIAEDSSVPMEAGESAVVATVAIVYQID